VGRIHAEGFQVPVVGPAILEFDLVEQVGECRDVRLRWPLSDALLGSSCAAGEFGKGHDLVPIDRAVLEALDRISGHSPVSMTFVMFRA
jgi:hypothetical protein